MPAASWLLEVHAEPPHSPKPKCLGLRYFSLPSLFQDGVIVKVRSRGRTGLVSPGSLVRGVTVTLVLLFNFLVVLRISYK